MCVCVTELAATRFPEYIIRHIQYMEIFFFTALGSSTELTFPSREEKEILLELLTHAHSPLRSNCRVSGSLEIEEDAEAAAAFTPPSTPPQRPSNPSQGQLS